ncbi:ROK family transcriptional regulator [Streptomyces sp. TRM68367]|nr:ROK family transcriptional regulator [Streptomyces sp. TRM68367]MBC9727059.1 ROK family transcriptional regulator [Streptomyces sp. TRM68367]
MPASPSTARAINDRLALRLLQEEGPLTAGQLKQLTGLSRPTVADLVERLTAAGLIEVVGEAGEQRRGPNARVYGIVAGRAHLAALDVRTEGVAVVVSDLLGRVLAEASVPIGDEAGTGPAVEQAVALVERVAKDAGADRLHTVGIGAPGLIDPGSGELRVSTGLPEWHRRLVAALQERLPEARVSVENETNLAALAEQRDGAARDRDTFVLLWLGHGTGAAVVLDGTLRRGTSGGTGEIGFLPVPGTPALPSATDCEGGFHSLAAAAAVADLARSHGISAPTTREPAAAELVRRAAAAVAAGPASGPGDDTATEATSLGADSHGARMLGEGVARPGTGGSGSGGQGALGGGSVGSVPGGGSGGARVPGSGAGGSGFGGQGALGGGPVGSVPRVGSGGARVFGDGAAGAGPVGGEPPGSGSHGDDHTAPGPRGVGPVPPGPPGVSRAVPVPPDALAPAPPTARQAARFLDALADRITVGVASVVAILDPGCVVLGGEVGQAGGEELASRVAARIRRMSPLPTEVRPSALGGAAVLRGALLTARDRAQDDLFAPPER